MHKSALQHILKHWNDAEEHFKQGLISEPIFLRARTGAYQTASQLRPKNMDDAAAQLTLAIALWREEIGIPTTPRQIAVDRMLGYVVEFLGNSEDFSLNKSHQNT